MLIELLLALLLGIFVGTLTGLTPGIHINLVGAGLISLSASIFYSINPLYLVIFIVSVAITHTFVDFIPSIFLGCPDTETALSILPGHQLLKEGDGYKAVMLSAYGGIAATISLIIISYPIVLIMKKIFPLLQDIIPYILIIVSISLIFTENKKIRAFVVFLITGILGFIVLNLDSLKEPLLPLLTGLFGSSALILSIKNKTKIPPQKIEEPKEKITKPLLGAIMGSPLCAFFPAFGSGQAALIGNSIFKTDNKRFLILMGATNMLVMALSFISLYSISKTRTGAAVAIKELIGTLSDKTFIIILICVLISGIASFFITKKLANYASKKIAKINYSTISIITLSILLIVVFLISGILGILVLINSTLTGIYAINSGARRTNMMGVLLIPTILLYLL